MATTTEPTSEIENSDSELVQIGSRFSLKNVKKLSSK